MNSTEEAASPTCGGTAGLLPAERARASFPVDELRRMMRGDRNELTQRYKESLFVGAPFDCSEMDVYLSYADRFEKRFERAARALEIVRENPRFMADHIKQKVQMADMFRGNASAAALHFTMFLTYLETQGNAEQLKKWRSHARQGMFMGCYAQTELGHGSNVRGIETEATYDLSTKEFVIHSPTLTSLKWWPTGMYAATHGMVFARLFIKGKDYGFHGFLVQFRDDKGCLMPGVEVGEMGPKISGETLNIGFARFTHVRVPHTHMFARGVSVSEDGGYIAAPAKLSRFKYISMMEVRVGLVRGSSRALGRAATIAVRYSCVRKQGFKDSQSENAMRLGENTIMDYQMQQYRLLKAVALAYMFHWNAEYIHGYLASVQDAIMGEDAAEMDRAADELPQLHATCAGMKATSSIWAHNIVEDLRKACGGQGYLLSNGIAEMTPRPPFDDLSASVTVEGEHIILSLQTARFLLKSIESAQRGEKVADVASYLAEPTPAAAAAAFTTGSHGGLIALLADRSRRQVLAFQEEFQSAQSTGMNFDEALNDSTLAAVKASELHSLYVMSNNFALAIEKYVQHADIKKVMERLFELMALQQIRENAGDWLEVLNAKSMREIHQRIKELLFELRPDAVAIVDAFGFPDSELRSTLGRYDGKVYEAIYKEALLSPLNQSSKMVGWDKFASVLDLEILREGMQTQRASKL